jgi:hypothetical protein
LEGKNQHDAPLPRKQDKNDADDLADGRRLTDGPGVVGNTAAEKASPNDDEQAQPSTEEFGEEGLGVAPKE